MARAAKRSRTARQPPPSTLFPINNLPDNLLVEVLCRLDDSKVISGCKRVSKRWCTLISDSYFTGSFLRLQHDQQKLLRYDYAMIPNRNPWLFPNKGGARYKTSVLTVSSQPASDEEKTIFDFLPCFPDQYYANKGNELTIAGTYNDLILCSPTECAQSDYCICNFYTKEWVRLPPTPRVVPEKTVPVGFICDPYYSIKEDSTISDSSIIKLNAEYRCRVVRLLPNDQKGFYVEIYSSDTGEWREYQLSEGLNSPQISISFSDLLVKQYMRTGVACNGKLYWWNHHGFIFELDPFNNVDAYRIVAAPALNKVDAAFRHIGVCQGRLRMCTTWLSVSDPVVIRELKENQVDGKPEWCVICDRVSLSQMIHKDPLLFDQEKTCISEVVGFHPSDGDILYLQFPKYTVMCNVREKTLEVAAEYPFHESETSYMYYLSHRECYPLRLPLWPTPVQKRLHYDEDYNVTVTGKRNLSLRLNFLTTLRQMKEKLGEDELYFNELLLDKKDDDKRLTLLGIGEDSEIHIDEDSWRKPAQRKRKRIAQHQS